MSPFAHNGVKGENDGLVVANKLQVAREYTHRVETTGQDYGNAEIADAKALLEGVTASETSAETARFRLRQLLRPDTDCSPAVTAYRDTAHYQDLLAIKATLRGDASLNWEASIPITDWRGISVVSDARLVGLILSVIALTGTIPGELGNLLNLKKAIL